MLLIGTTDFGGLRFGKTLDELREFETDIDDGQIWLEFACCWVLVECVFGEEVAV